MTVAYADESFQKLLFRWKGSIWKSIWKEFVVFMALYIALNTYYRVGMTPEQQEGFERLVQYMGSWPSRIPLNFLLGFYVNYVVNRWWSQLLALAWPDKLLLLVTALMPGMDNEKRLIRRTICRWINLHCVLVWRQLCTKIKKRFPTEEHLVQSGLMTESELKLYQATTKDYERWFVPCSWIVNLFSELRFKKELISDAAMRKLVDELDVIRRNNLMLGIYDWVSAPLRYTQVVTVATYGYFFISLIARQDLDVDPSKTRVTVYVPLVTMMEFLFYVGWLKVGEEYRVPFGEDDDDFDMNYLLDRNFHVSHMLVDELAGQLPDLVEDKFWNSRHPRLPHTIASYLVRDRIPQWRLEKYRVPDDVAKVLPVPDADRKESTPWPPDHKQSGMTIHKAESIPLIDEQALKDAATIVNER